MMDVNSSINSVGTVVTACAGEGTRRQFPRRLEKVKFGADLGTVCKRNIPGPLLLIILKLNKEGPFKKDVFRAPGHHGNMRKLIHFLQQGRIINIQNFSVNTIASVLKKFLRKIPGGIFGPDNERQLFQIMKSDSEEDRKRKIGEILSSLPIYTQHLLVLLFGTFRVISTKSDKTGMTSEALGVSVAPSFFHSCSTGKTAKMEDVQRFKNATRVTSYFIEQFGMTWLFSKEIYEYYARLTGRILRVENKFIFFTYPLEMLGTRDDLTLHSTLSKRLSDVPETGSLEMIPQSCALDPQGRLSISLEHGVSGPPSPTLTTSVSPSPHSPHHHNSSANDIIVNQTPSDYHHHPRDDVISSPTHSVEQRSATMSRLQSGAGGSGGGSGKRRMGGGKIMGTGASEYKSAACLPQVHMRQRERMKARSDWFLSEPSGLVTVRVRNDPNLLASSGRPISLGGQPPQTVSPERRAVVLGPTEVDPQQLLYLQQQPPANQPPQHQTSFTGKKLDQSASTAVSITGKPPDGQPFQGGAVALRRRLSDKDKERRLVRRSSSKRKDKENGGADPGQGQSGPALKRTNSGEGNTPSLSRTHSHDSHKGLHSRGGSFDYPDICTPPGSETPLAASTPVHTTSSRSLPRI